MPELLIRRKAYTRSDGIRVKSATFKAKDKGAPGRTPKSKRWYRPSVTTGWLKSDAQRTRIAKVVKAHKGSLLSAARSLRALANVTADPETSRKAGQDARVLFERYKRARR